MLKLKNYKMGFDVWGLVVFALIMCPNIIWFAFPAVNDVLRNESVTPQIDMIASISQVILVTSLCILINTKKSVPIDKRCLICMIISTFVYYLGWSIYYLENTNAVVILILCIAPCLTFIIFSISRKNIVALVAATVFAICHLIYGIVNFII